MTDREAILHLVRLGVQGKYRDCEMLAIKLARRRRKSGDDDFANELEALVREHSLVRPESRILRAEAGT